MQANSDVAGLTLIELLITIAVIGIAVLAIWFRSGSSRDRAYDVTRKNDIERIKVALYEHHFDTGCFPTSLPECGQPLEGAREDYLTNFPCDPNGNSYVYEIDTAETCPSWFKLLTNLTVNTDPSIELSGCIAGCGESCNYNYGVSSTNTRVDDGCIVYYVCSPGGGQEGACEAYDDPTISQCPVVFPNDPTCKTSCADRNNRCKNSSGKHVPD